MQDNPEVHAPKLIKHAWSRDFDFSILTTTCATLLNSKVSLKMKGNSYNTSDEIAIQCSAAIKHSDSLSAVIPASVIILTSVFFIPTSSSSHF